MAFATLRLLLLAVVSLLHAGLGSDAQASAGRQSATKCTAGTDDCSSRAPHHAPGRALAWHEAEGDAAFIEQIREMQQSSERILKDHQEVAALVRAAVEYGERAAPRINATDQVKMMVRKARQLQQSEELAGRDELLDYYEFGVFTGGTLQDVIKEAHQIGLRFGHLWGFDSFSGLSGGATAGKEVPLSQFRTGKFSATRSLGGVDAERVKRHIIDGVHPASYRARVGFVEGFYNVSLTPDLRAQRQMRRALAIEIDCDLYEASKQALTWVFQNGLAIPGVTLVYYDEYMQGGEAIAHREITREYGAKWEDLGGRGWIGFKAPYNRVFRLLSLGQSRPRSSKPAASSRSSGVWRPKRASTPAASGLDVASGRTGE
eukprot:1845942-Prymnesium_polylepis.1